MPIQAPPIKAPAPPSSAPSQAPPTRKEGPSPKPNQQGDAQEQQKQQRKQQAEQKPKQKKFGKIFMAWCHYWAGVKFIIALILFFFGLDDIGITDTIYGYLVSFPIIAYCWVYGIPGVAVKAFVEFLFSFIPYSDLIPKNIFLATVFWITNSKTGIAQRTKSVAVTAQKLQGKGGSMPSKSGAGMSTLGK